MSYVVNVVGRKRVRDRKELIRRSLEREGLPTGNYTNKHTIYIDTNSNTEAACTTSHNTAAPQENDRTTYDINDITSSTVPVDEFVEEYVERLGRIRTTLLKECWRHWHGGASKEIEPAIERLGYRVRRLEEYRNAEFVFAEGVRRKVVTTSNGVENGSDAPNPAQTLVHPGESVHGDPQAFDSEETI